MVLESVRLLREDETRRLADIEFDFPEGLPSVFVDQIQIQQVLLNLITNGIEATQTRGAHQRFSLLPARLTTGPRRSRLSITVGASPIATRYSTHLLQPKARAWANIGI